MPLCSRLSLLSREEQIPMNLDNKVEFTVSYSNTYDNCFMHTLCVCISSIAWLQKNFWQISITTQQNCILSTIELVQLHITNIP